MNKLILIPFILLSFKGFTQDLPDEQAPILVDKLSNNIIYANYTTSVVPKNAFQIDVDFIYERFRMEDWRTPFIYSTTSLPDFKIRYGIFKNVELRAGSRLGYNQVIYSLYPSQHMERIREVHIDYITLGAKANLISYNNKKGRLGALAETYVPVLRPEKVLWNHFLPTFTLINSNQWNRWLGYNLNAGAHFNYLNGYTRPSQQPLVHFYQFNLTPIFQLSNKVKVYTGINAIVNKIYYNNGAIYNFQAGMLINPNNALQLRLSGAIGEQGFPALGNTRTNLNLGLAWRPNF